MVLRHHQDALISFYPHAPMTHTATPAEPLLLPHFDLLATAPGGVARLRELILTLAVQGKLVPQDPSDEPASVLLQRIRAEKDRLIAAGKIKRDKPLPPIADEEKPFELPGGWEWVRCADYFLELCTGPFGSVIHKEDYVSDGVPLINPSHMIDGKIIHDPRVTLKPKDAIKLSAYTLSAGDLVLARRGEVGRYALVTEREAGWLCGTGSFFIRLHSSCNRTYLGLTFLDSRFRQNLQVESVGTTMTNLNQRILLEALIALPPLAEQSRIVARVEELMRLCDALEAQQTLHTAQHTQLVQTLLGTLTDSATPAELADQWQRVAAHFDTLFDRPEAVDALEQTILQLAVRGLLVPQDPNDEPASVLLQRIRAEKDRLIAAGKIKRDKPLPPIADEEKPFELPPGWEWVRLANIVRVLNGRAYNKQELLEAGSTPVLRVGNLFTSNHWYYSNLKLEPEKYCNKGDLLYSWSASFGPFIWKGPKVIYHYHIWKLESWSPKNVDVGYLHKFLTEQTAAIKAAGHGVSMVHMTKEKMEKIIVPYPPLAEQSRIVARVEELRQLCDNLRQRLAAGRTTQRHLAEALLESAGAA